MIHDTYSDQISQKQDGHNIHVIIKTMCPPGYYNHGFVAAWALNIRLNITGTNEPKNAKQAKQRV